MCSGCPFMSIHSFRESLLAQYFVSHFVEFHRIFDASGAKMNPKDQRSDMVKHTLFGPFC